MGKLYERKLFSFGTIGNTEILSPPDSPIAETFEVQSVEVGNSSGSAAAAGICVRHPAANWKAGQWDNSATESYSDDSTDAQDAGANDFTIAATGTSDGFVIQSKNKFNYIGMTVGSVEGGSPAYEYSYWDSSNGWTTFTPISSLDFTATGESYAIFSEFDGWDPVDSTATPVDTDGLTAGYYAVRVRATTPPSSPPLATKVWVQTMFDYVESVDDGKSEVLPKGGGDAIRVPVRGALVPFCGTANAANWAIIEYRKVR